MAPTHRILVVEDDKDQSMLFMSVLGMHGFVATAVDDAESALPLLDEHAFDLLLTDWYLPGMHGDELIRTVKERTPEQKAILMSCGHDIAQAARACHADAWLQKGDILRLVTVIKQVISDGGDHGYHRDAQPNLAAAMSI